jgi:hypothetical protein
MVKFYNWKILAFFTKIANYLPLGFHAGRSSYRRGLQPSKRTSST